MMVPRLKLPFHNCSNHMKILQIYYREGFSTLRTKTRNTKPCFNMSISSLIYASLPLLSLWRSIARAPFVLSYLAQIFSHSKCIFTLHPTPGTIVFKRSNLHKQQRRHQPPSSAVAGSLVPFPRTSVTSLEQDYVCIPLQFREKLHQHTVSFLPFLLSVCVSAHCANERNRKR